MEVKDAGFAVRVERDDVLGIGEAAGRPVASLFSGQPDPIESLDEILFNPIVFTECGHSPKTAK